MDAWLDANCSPEHYRWRIGRSGYRVLVARDPQGTPVGVAVLRQRGDRADMSGLYVLEPGRGVGSELVAERNRLARQLGCTRMRASVWRTNQPARRFVEAQGLSRTGGGFRDRLVGVRVDHYEGPLPAD